MQANYVRHYIIFIFNPALVALRSKQPHIFIFLIKHIIHFIFQSLILNITFKNVIKNIFNYLYID